MSSLSVRRLRRVDPIQPAPTNPIPIFFFSVMAKYFEIDLTFEEGSGVLVEEKVAVRMVLQDRGGALRADFTFDRIADCCRR